MTRSFFNTEFFFIVMSHYSTRIGITEGKKGVEASEGSGEDVMMVMMQKGRLGNLWMMIMTVFKNAEETTNYCVKYLPELISYYLK